MLMIGDGMVDVAFVGISGRWEGCDGWSLSIWTVERIIKMHNQLNNLYFIAK